MKKAVLICRPGQESRMNAISAAAGFALSDTLIVATNTKDGSDVPQADQDAVNEVMEHLNEGEPNGHFMFYLELP